MKEKQFKIESGIPIPKMGRKSTYPLGEMNVGDSFVFADPYTMQAQSAATCAFISWKKHSNIPGVQKWKFISRKVDNTLRVWRVY